jgi:hypothetical protein
MVKFKKSPRKVLTEAHLVGEDAVDAVVLQADHPVQPLQLVVSAGERDRDREKEEQVVMHRGTGN